MRVDGVSFNVEWTMAQTEDQFISNKCNQHLWPELTAERRKESLKQAYRIIKKYSENNSRSISNAIEG